jgi:tRNA A64-2'-O-ribosylphosphate transferase
MPDALSTTVPIWCAVLNRALFPASDPRSQELFLPPHLPATTHAQITALLPSFVTSLKELNLQLPRCLAKPLRPFWVTQDSQLPAEDDDEGDEDGDLAGEPNTEMNAKKKKPVPPIFEDYRPVICCTASRRIVGGSEMDEGGYIQGAGDDTENWAHGLTPPVFWKHSQELLDTPETDLPSLIATLVETHEAHLRAAGAVSRTKLTKHISVCPLPLEKDASPTPGECRIALTPEVSPRDSWVQSPTYMEVGVGKSKTASRNLRLALPDICQFASKYLSSNQTHEEPQIVIACQSGKDLSVGAALAANCYLFDNDDNVCIQKEDARFTKTMVKIRLGKIMTAFPEANPSRATLQSVNSFLMDWRQ